MNLRQLEVFCAVVKCESFTAAGEQLFMSQPAVSMQVQAVERDFGVQLVERRNRRVMLTEAGAMVYRWASEVLRMEREARKAIDELKRAETGRLVVGATMALGSHVLPQVIHQFKRDHPGAEVVIRLADREEVFQEILAGTIDVGVIIEGEATPGLELETVGSEEMVFICGPSHRLAERERVTLNDLAKEPFVVPPKGWGYRRVTDQILAIQGLDEVQVLMEVGMVEGIKRAVEQGVAIGLMLRSAVEVELERGWLRELNPPRGQPTVDLCIVRRPHQRPSPMLEALLAMLRVALREQWWRTQSVSVGDGREPLPAKAASTAPQASHSG